MSAATGKDGIVMIRDWLSRLRHRGKLLVLGSGGIWTAVMVAALLVVMPVLEAVFRFTPSGRWVLVIVSAGLAGVVVLFGVLNPAVSMWFLKTKPRDQALARLVGRKVPDIRDRLLNALQLGRIFDNPREHYSQDLAVDAIDRVTEDLNGVELKQVRGTDGVSRALKVLGGTVAALAVVYLVGSAPLMASLNRLSHPSKDFPRPMPFQLLVSPGDTKALKGDTVSVEVVAQGGVPKQVQLYTQLDSRKEPDEYLLDAVMDTVFRYQLGPVRESMEYWAKSGPVTAGPYRLLVRERPFVRSLQAKVIPPAYSKLPVSFGEDNVGDVTVLKGSKVDLFAQANLELAEGWLEIVTAEGDSSRQELEVLGNRLNGQLSVMEDFVYRIRMQDHEGVTDRDPIWYRMTTLLDREPVVKIVQPPGDVEVTDAMMISMLAEALDDFGISKMALRFHRANMMDPEDLGLDDYKSTNLQYQVDDDGLVRSDWLWDLDPLNLLPEDEVSFYVEVWDNDVVTGPKRGRSEVLTIRYPSLEDLYAETNQTQEDIEEELIETLEAAQELAEAMEEITEEWKRNPEMTWEEEQRLEQVMQRQQELSETVQEIQQQMEEMISSLQENSLFTQETLEKYMELQELFQQVATEELKEAMRKLQEAMERQNPEDLLAAMEEFQMTQEQFEKSLDRSLNILKQLELEMKMDELVKRVDELLERQESINKELDGAKDDQSMNELSEQENEMASDMESLEKEFQKAQEMAEDAMGQQPQEMQDIDQFMDQEKLPTQMQSMASSMSSSQKSSSKKKGGKISSKLNQLSQMMQSAKQSITQQKMDELMAALERATANLLRLSFGQEGVLDEAQDLDAASPRFDDVATRQQDMRSGLTRVADSVYAISRETFFISPQIGAALGEAMQKMDNSIDGCNLRDPRRVGQNGRAAMGALNRSVILMQQAADQMSKSCSSTGGEEMMKQLSQMSCQQEGLNQSTMSLFQGNQGQFSMQEQRTMRRLAAEQGQLQKSLEELAQEAGETENMMGRLDEVGQAMGDVAQELQNLNLNERTLRRQEKILTRLLDAQRSVREREYSPKRKSRTGEDIVRTSPRMRDPHTDAESIRQDLLKALEGHYVRDYERLIRMYFDALARETVTGE